MDLIHIVWEISPSVPHYLMKIYPLLGSWEMKIQIIHLCQETLRHLAIWLPLLFWTNISTPSELLTQKIIVIWILWSSYSSILRTISHNFQFNPSTEGSISKFLFEIARSASSSTDVDALKFRLVQYDKFYCGEQQEDASECLMMLIELINKGSVPYCGSNDNDSTGVSLSEILFSFMLEKYIVCDACGLRSPSSESSSVLYITPTCTYYMQELIKQGMEQKLEMSCFRCKKNTWHVEPNYILQPPKYLIIVVNRFRYINNNFTKDRCSIPMDMTVVIGLHKFSLQATIDHHGPSLYSGHYTASINCCKRTFYCNDSKNYGVWNYWCQKLLYCLCGNV